MLRKQIASLSVCAVVLGAAGPPVAVAENAA